MALGVGEKQRSLAEIVEHQSRQDDGEPAEADRQAAEMAHIRIHRLGAGDGEEGGAEHGETDARRRMEQVDQRMMRAECAQDAGCRNDAAQAEHADGDKPDQHHRPEDVADERGSLALDQEQANQDRDADRNDDRRELGCVELETFDGAQHRDGRRDDAVAVEQRGADQPDDQQGGAPASGRRMPDIEKRQQRDDAALAAVVGAHDQDRVFERDDQDQRPEDQRHDAHDGFGRERSAGVCGLLERIERAGADIAVDDAERRESGGGGQRPGFDPGQRRRLKGSGHSCVLPRPPQV